MQKSEFFPNSLKIRSHFLLLCSENQRVVENCSLLENLAVDCFEKQRTLRAREIGEERGVAQLGSAPVLGTGGRQFESGHPDALWNRKGSFDSSTGILEKLHRYALTESAGKDDRSQSIIPDFASATLIKLDHCVRSDAGVDHICFPRAECRKVD